MTSSREISCRWKFNVATNFSYQRKVYILLEREENWLNKRSNRRFSYNFERFRKRKKDSPGFDFSRTKRRNPVRVLIFRYSRIWGQVKRRKIKEKPKCVETFKLTGFQTHRLRPFVNTPTSLEGEGRKAKRNKGKGRVGSVDEGVRLEISI